MKHLALVERSVPFPSASTEQRNTPRVPVSSKLMYACVRQGEVLLGDGSVVDLSRNGLGIRGTHQVRAGMELPAVV